MAIVYAADFDVVDRASWRPALVKTVIAEICGWAGLVEAPRDDEYPGHRPGSSVTTRTIADASTLTAWRLVLDHPDGEDPQLRWRVDCLVVGTGKTEVQVRLHRARTDAAIMPTGDRPRPPGCIRAVIASDDLAVVDGGRELAVEPGVVRYGDAAAFANLVCSLDRRLPIVAYTPRDDDVIDGEPLARDLAGLAHVLLVDSAASWALADLLPRGVNVYGGAARLIWPGVTRAERGPVHPLWYADAPPRRVCSQVTSRVITAGLALAREHPKVAEVERRRRQSEAHALLASLLEIRERFEIGTLESAEMSSRLAGAENAVKDLETERAEWEAFASQLDEENRQLKANLFKAQNESTHWQGVAESALRRGESATAETGDELRLAIQEAVDAMGSVDGARPRRYAVGSGFPDTVTSLGPSYREKILRTCAAVIVNAPGLLAGRDDHELRSGRGPHEPPVQRVQDGASARRIAIEQNTPAARRLHYWSRPDGSVEFASVNTHEDMDIPEGS